MKKNLAIVNDEKGVRQVGEEVVRYFRPDFPYVSTISPSLFSRDEAFLNVRRSLIYKKESYEILAQLGAPFSFLSKSLKWDCHSNFSNELLPWYMKYLEYSESIDSLYVYGRDCEGVVLFSELCKRKSIRVICR